MAAGYRAGFTRDSTTDETFAQARSTFTTAAMIHGFQRRTDDGSDGLVVVTATDRFRCGFLRDVGAGGEPGLGGLSAVQEADLTAPTHTGYWRNGFFREVGTDRLLWVLAGTPGLVATMQHGFLRSQRGDLVLD